MDLRKLVRRRPRAVVIGLTSVSVVFAAGIGIWAFSRFAADGRLAKKDLAKHLSEPVMAEQFPTRLQLQDEDGPEGTLKLRYTIQEDLQDDVRDLFESYKPDYGSFVAVDASTGQILSMVSYAREDKQRGNLAVQATFPAASIFKMVTAAAAIDQRKLSPDSVIPFNGRAHTLYRRNVASNETNRWTRFVDLKEAFAKSINTVFGKIGAFYLGAPVLEDYAHRFGFNRELRADFGLQESRLEIDDAKQWSVVEAASGFTRHTTLSPVHAALMAASVANDGVMMEPYLVESVRDDQGQEIYKAEPRVASVTMDPVAAAEVRTLMRETVRSGTSRSVFRTFIRGKKYKEVEVGGKTGSLTGDDPKGRCDWFVGYAGFRGRQVAFASVTVHEKYWRVKSAYLARKFLESYVHETLEDPVYVGANQR